MDDLTLKITQRSSDAKSLFSDLVSVAIGIHISVEPSVTKAKCTINLSVTKENRPTLSSLAPIHIFSLIHMLLYLCT